MRVLQQTLCQAALGTFVAHGTFEIIARHGISWMRHARGPGSSRNSQLWDEDAVVQFTHIHNHAGSNGPGRRFVKHSKETIFMPIQALEL